VTVVPFEVK